MKGCLTMRDVYEVVCSLAQSQGFYGRVREDMKECWDEWEAAIEQQQFTNDLDFILWLEGQAHKHLKIN